MKELSILLKTDDANLAENAEAIEKFDEELKKLGWGYVENGKIFCDESKESDVINLFDKYMK